ncbi:MAG: hypothetical protein WBA31_02455 [Candidatus Dormiibacterota bacterium]
MAEETSAAGDSQALSQGLTDLRQTWEHVARELAPGVPELPGVIEQELAALALSDLREETLTKVSESVVARVADAGLPDQATALSRRMGRAMYEFLLLQATQEEIRELGLALAAIAPPETPSVSAPPALQEEEAIVSWEAATSSVGFPVAQPPPPVRPGPPAVTAAPLEPRDPVRPARGKNGVVPALGKGAPPEPAPTAPPAAAPRPVPPAVGAPASPALSGSKPAESTPPATTAPPPGEIKTEDPPATKVEPLAAAAERVPSQAAPPSNPVPSAPAVDPKPEAPKPPAQPAPALAPSPAPSPALHDLSDEEAPLWGFDPAARTEEPGAEPATAPVPQPAPQPQPKVPATVAASPRPGGQLAVGERRPELGRHSGWTVRLSPRISTEQERKLAAREAELPALLEEIVAAAKSQQEAIPAKSAARRALAATRETLPLAEGTDPAGQIQALLEAGEMENAAATAVQLANDQRGEDAADLVCDVGDAIQSAQQLDLAVICFTAAVLASPPCDRACWKLCTLSVERRDAVMAPVWLEFVARLLRARGADVDAISVYRQLLKLAPRRVDIRELLRISSLTGTLPD